MLAAYRVLPLGGLPPVSPSPFTDAHAAHKTPSPSGAAAIPRPQPLLPPSVQAQLQGGAVRSYFLRVEAVEWQFQQPPAGALPCSAAPGGLDAPSGLVPTSRTVLRYIQYTNASFLERSPQDATLGLLGPLLRGVVGDTLRVTVANNASRYISLHPHGVFYAKGSEGAPYADGSAPGERADDNLLPGGMHTYVWALPASAGPGPAGLSGRWHALGCGP
jgi:hephaestin